MGLMLFPTILRTQVISQLFILCTVHLPKLHFKLVCEDVGEAMSAILKWRSTISAPLSSSKQVTSLQKSTRLLKHDFPFESAC